MFETYKPSGRFGGMAIPFLFVGIVVAAAASFVYHLGLHWIPLIYVSFLLTFGFGKFLGFMGAKFVDIAKIRNVPFAIAMGLLFTLAGLGGKFVFQHQQMITDTAIYLQDTPEGMGMEPAEIEKRVRENLTFVEHIKARVDQGWNIGRGGGGAPISGFFVYLVWLVEFGIIVWSAVGTPQAEAGRPFSESLGEWATEEEAVMMLPVNNDEMVNQIKSATTVDQLLEIPIPKTDESDQFALYTVNSIPGEELEDAYLTVDLNRYYVDNEGNQKCDTTPLVKHAILTTDQRKQLIENAELLNEALAEYREAVEAEAAATEETAASETAEPEEQS